MSDPPASEISAARAIARAAPFCALWLMLDGIDPASLPVGIFAVTAATWTSLQLMPPGRSQPSPLRLAGLALRFGVQSVVAGLDVARRALDPRLPLRPGFVIYRSGLSPGPALNAFCTLASLAPGTLPSGMDDQGSIVVHCLDVEQPVTAQLADDEARFTRAVGCGG